MKTIGRYEILETLGRGAMGEVFKGRDEALDRIVAIKVIRDVAASETAVERFQREARAAARLSHPNIITVYEFGDHEGCPFIAMEYLDGEDLGDLLRRCPELPVEKQIDIIRQAAIGLHFAHQKGIIHRDVKPANIAVLRDGTVKIMDFGIAKLGDTKLTQTGSVMGTVRYMPPEQIQGMDLDGRADLFSLGVTFYEMLTGVRAFDGDSMTNVIYNVMNRDPQPIRVLDGTPHEWLQSVVHPCLEKNRENRWPDCQAFVEALDRRRPVQPGDRTGATRRAAARAPAVFESAGNEDATREFVTGSVVAPTQASPPQPRGSRKWPLAAAAVVLLAVVGGAALWLGGGSERSRLIAEAEAALREQRVGQAKDLLLEAESAKGSPEDLERARTLFAGLFAELRAAGDPLAAKAVLDQVAAWRGPSADTRADYRALARELATAGLPEQGPPFLSALEQSVEAYGAGLGGEYRSASDHPLMAECVELGEELVRRAAESELAPQLRASLYDLARKLFLFVDEHEPGFNAFERANHARVQRAQLSEIARALDRFRAEVDGLVAEAEKLERDPATQLQAIGNYRAVLSLVAESSELAEHVALDSYRELSEDAIVRLEESLRTARQQLSRDKQTASLGREASQLEQQGNLPGALELYEELLSLDPGDARSQAKVAELRAARERLEGLKRAVETALSKKQFEAARGKLAEASKLAPSDADVAALGASLRRLEEADRAAEEGEVLLAEAAALRAAGDVGAAEERYLQISASTGDDGVRRRADEAVRELRRARQEEEIRPLVEQARRLERQGDLNGALAAWEQVQRRSASWPGVKGELQRLRRLSEAATSEARAAQARERESERTSRAVTEAREALGRDEPQAALAALEGLDAAAAGDVGELRGQARELARRHDAARARLQAAESALAAGRADEATREARAAAASWPALRSRADEVIARAERARAAASSAAASVDSAGPEQEVDRVLQAYAAAIREADLRALQQLWPSLKGKQLKGIRESFGFAKSHEVDLKVVSLDVQGEAATVVCERRDRLETQDGQVVQNDSRATFRLRSSGAGWLIDSIE